MAGENGRWAALKDPSIWQMALWVFIRHRVCARRLPGDIWFDVVLTIFLGDELKRDRKHLSLVCILNACHSVTLNKYLLIKSA